MYGMLLEAIQHYIQLEYGEELWKEILRVSNCKHTVFNTHQIYPDTLALELGQACAKVTGASYDKFLAYFGKCFFRFTSKFGYDATIKATGRYFTEFLESVDNIHHQFSFTYPKMKSPSMYLTNIDENGCVLVYRSSRPGYTKYLMDRFVGKVAVVTGASAGIGKAIVEALVKQGIIVAAIARRLERLQDHAKQLSKEKGKLHPYQCDVSNQEQILATFNKITSDLGPIHILVNNAGLSRATNIIEGVIDKWKLTIDTNLLGAAICIREAVASMKENNIKGHVITINSVAGHVVQDYAFFNVYPATKHGLKALTETVRLEINREKLPIKITSISPGYVKTEFVREFLEADEAPKDWKVDSRPGLESNDLADAALYVLSTPEHVNVKELIVTAQGTGV